MARPLKQEWVSAALVTYQLLTDMIARWDDGIPGQTRAELIRLRETQEALLIRQGLLGPRSLPPR